MKTFLTRARRELRRRAREERGAYAILFSMVLVLVIALAAIAIDVSSQVASRQSLKDTMDMAAHAAAFELPDNVARAPQVAIDMAKANDRDSNPVSDLWCVVGSTGATKTPNLAQIPGTCNPGKGAPYTTANYPGMVCDENLCFIPCAGTASKCNTVRVADQKTVPYAFAPAIGFDEGNTGAVVSVACKGSCGSEIPNPMDIVMMADRTASMSATNRAGMVQGIKDTLTTMQPSMHYVAFGTLHKSVTSSTTCKTNPTRDSSHSVTDGTWIPVPFNNKYLNASGALDANNDLVKAVTCLPESPSGEFGTHLAGGLKGAARYLLGLDSNNLSSLPSRSGNVTKAIIFETDGMPDEVLSSSAGALSLDTSGDIGAGSQSSNGTSVCNQWDRRGNCTGTTNEYRNTNGQKGCDNFINVATQTKAKKAMIVTIGFGDANTARCKRYEPHTGTYSSSYVRDVLAQAASPHPLTGQPSKADSDCSTAAQRAAENNDGDFYFCAASGSELGPIFKTALTSLSGTIKLLKMPKG